MKIFRQMRNYSRLKNIAFVLCFLIQLSATTDQSYIQDQDDHIQSEQDLFGEGSKQLSEINILLPIQNCKSGKDCRRAYQKVVAYHGCFEWRISHPNLIDMEPIPSQSHPECNNVVRISNVQQRETKSVIWLTAKDKRSGQALTAEITVGRVARLQIFSRFRQIPKGDRQQLQVRAYDDEGNVFSTLDGFHFDWTEVSGGSNILRISRDQAEYRGQKASVLRGSVDAYKNHGDYFLKAQENGVTALEVRMLEKGYEKLRAAKITLTIVDPFIILAAESDEDISERTDEDIYSPAYILPTSQFSFKLALIRNQDNMGSQLEMIKTPSAKYLWELGQQFQSLGTIDKKGDFQSLNKPGRAEIKVVDQDFKNNTAHAEIYIVEPFKLQLEIADVTESFLKQAVTNSKTKVSSFRKQLNVTNWADEWILVEGRHYLIKAYLYDKDHNRIWQTRQLDFQSTLDKKYFEQVEKNLIGSELIVKVKPLGRATQANAAPKTVLRASLNEVKSSQRNKFKVDSSKLKDEKEVTLTRPVQIVHPSNLILLPHIKAMGGGDVGQIWHVRAVGGAGSYTWRSADPSVASVGQPHLVRAGDVGLTVLTVADLRNPDNFATIQVEVQPVHHLLWLQDRVEALSEQQGATGEGSGPQGLPSGSGGISTLSTIAVASQQRRFTNCTGLALSYDVKARGELVGEPSETSWADVQKYVRSPAAQELIKLQNRFAQQPGAVFQSDLVEGAETTETELQHNNFGICQQVKVRAEGVGLARVKAVLGEPGRTVESTDAEIASYSNLETVKPDYTTFLQDLYSRSQSGQEFQTFGGFSAATKNGKQVKHFIISFGSTITLELAGGSNFWRELSDEYKTGWTISSRKGTSEDVLALGVKSETANSTLITVQCSAPADLKSMGKSFDYTVLITQQGRVSKHLLEPVPHQDSVRISCTPPESQRLLWAQSSSADSLDAPANLPRSRLNANIRTYSALVNSENYLRLLVLDKKGHASMNHSSIITTFSSSDSALATLSEIKQGNEVLAADYDKRLVKFHNQTGTVFINAVSQKYNGAMMMAGLNKKAAKSSFFGGAGSSAKFDQGLFVGHAVKDQMRIDIVKNLDIEPRFKSIYFNGKKNPCTFQLSQGSGHFAVKVNDTESLAYVQHIGRQVTIIPRSEGSLLITVEDVDLPESLPVTAELLISSVARLNLDTQGFLIEKGSSTNMTVTALDSHGIEFDEDQYQQMTFDVEIEKTDIENDKGKGERRKFNATGTERGHYGVTAHIEKFRSSNGHNQKTSTNENKIEVFPALRLQPDKLLLTPQMKYTLKVEGGPSRSPYGANARGGQVVTNFTIEDPKVASIDSSNEVTGETVGDSVLRVQIYHIVSANQRKDSQEWRSLVSEKQIFVKVRLVTAIAIPDNQQRMVYTGSLLKQLAVLKYNNETFTHGIAPVSFSWNCSNPDILEPNPSLLEPLQYQRNGQDREPEQQGSSRYSGHQTSTKTIRDNLKNNAAVFSSSFNSSGIHARALRAGEATLQVTMAIEYPRVYRRDQNWFQTSALLKVQDQLSVAVPEFIPDADKHTHLYLLPPRTLSKISTNKKTRLQLGYSMLSVYDYSSQRYEYREAKTPIIQLVDNEAIRTLDKYGKVTVHIAEDQGWGGQVVMLNVLIADIYSLSATHKHHFYEALSLPLGSTLKMPIKFQNEHAHLFANGIEGVEVGIQLSHPSVVTAQLDRYNQSLTLDSQGSGECNVVLYLIENPEIFDVFKVRVATLVQPGSPVHLHVGSQVSFRIVADAVSSLPSGDIKWSSSVSSILAIDSQDGTAVALDEGSANILLSGKKSEMELEAASIAHVSQVSHAEVEQNGWNDLLLDVEEGGHLRIRLKLFLGNQVEELMPVTQYDGVTLIRQNVQLKCQTDQPKFVEARVEVNDVEGYFCNVRYVGPSRGSHKDTPQRARIKATVSTAATKGKGSTQPRPYSKDLLSFDVALVGRLLVDKKYRNGVKLGQFSRTRQLVVHSLSDFDVKKSLDDKTLRVQRSRDRHDSNDHVISITVTRATNHTIKTEVTLVHRVTGETVVIPIIFDPTDRSGSVYDTPPKRTKAPKPQARSPEPESEPAKAPSATAYIMFLFLVFLVYMFFSHPNVDISSLFTGCSRYLQGLMNAPAGGYNSDDNSRSYYSARGTDASRYGASPARSRNPYTGVRNSVFSPDGKARQRDAPYNRFQQSRGSVVSPQSMYRPVDGDSVHH